MQVSPVSPQPRLIMKIYKLHKRLRMQKQAKRIEEQKQYMQMLRQRKENPNLIKHKQHRPILELTMRLFVGSYLVFLFAFILFYVIPHPTKQLLGYQFYEIKQSELLPKTVVVKRVAFNDYRKGDSFLYQSNASIPFYQVGIIQSIDVANYTVTTSSKNANTTIPKEQVVGIVIHTADSVVSLMQNMTNGFIYANGILLFILILQIAKEAKLYLDVKSQQ